MTVARILAEKGRSVVTVEPQRTLDEAIHLLAEKRIGAVVVSDAAGTVLGILSERDIMRALARQGAGALDALVSEHMTATVVTCARDTSVEDVMHLMTDGRFRHVPVLEEGRLAGLISIGDVVKRRIAAVEAEHQAMRDYITMA
ncbi:inosine-5-monophosphate dehydrogenase [Methylobacterium sp. Leaf469]|jgi:CBS domain-containing protein|uniref:CBS domain-containing protein n=1 Tax=unclassified Methylobacterium TaxID=2615210 RepID=UPI0006F739F0|nr:MULTISPECIES: CBS domain-containing protein [unclassified Methylobacterium]USU31907.1 CBS domain-containing protein [Methylobacterium sp. OTU13CASTA1]KQO70369.1 inosine-5-monophosphate dehydrogenase [Methylobacterium sp. Leaf87]KQP32585.1 inosine-5-monophosphate dehydrogenase [Methylobacterium sp. Leaf102]KQP33196.1 inosine-5-monophosphate dehydrogenase [Methylobacterium sp. Leaf100]KQP67908.1 inosine-5-monophosphate dehydrogenase [Methylobacterium sp. Leaf112]